MRYTHPLHIWTPCRSKRAEPLPSTVSSLGADLRDSVAWGRFVVTSSRRHIARCIGRATPLILYCIGLRGRVPGSVTRDNRKRTRVVALIALV